MTKFKIYLTLMLLVIMQAALSSCTGDSDEFVPPELPTTYTLTAELYAEEIAAGNNLTSKLDFMLCEYNNLNELVNIQKWDNIEDGVNHKTFYADEHATKLVVQMNVYAYRNGKEVANVTLYNASVIYLKQKGHLNIKIDGNTLSSKFNPLS